ncbi:MAG: acyl-CoA dehydrogenase family protein, partial [Candidatus Dormibacteria bacterium]
MVSFELSAEQLEMKQWIHEFAAKKIRPAAEEWDEKEEMPWP